MAFSIFSRVWQMCLNCRPEHQTESASSRVALHPTHLSSLHGRQGRAGREGQ